MDRVGRCALMTKLVEVARKRGVWCGEMQIQIMVLFVQELMEVPIGAEFVFYRRGPFSFNLRDELTGLHADGLIEVVPGFDKKGPYIAVTDRGRKVQDIGLTTLDRYVDRIEYTVEKLRGMGVVEIKRIAAAYYVLREDDGSTSVADRTKEVENACGFERSVASRVVEDIGRLVQDAKCFVRANGKETEEPVPLIEGPAKGGRSKRGGRKSTAVMGQPTLPALREREARRG